MPRTTPTYSMKEVLLLLLSIETLSEFDKLFDVVFDDIMLYEEYEFTTLRVFLKGRRRELLREN